MDLNQEAVQQVAPGSACQASKKLTLLRKPTKDSIGRMIWQLLKSIKLHRLS
jgi:hypothetical protein